MKYTYEEALGRSVEYFNGDELAARVFVDKYSLRDAEDNILEDSPEKMHRRIAKEFARVESKKYKNTSIDPLSEEEIFNLLDRFKYIVPQGSPMYGIGNDYQTISLSNCYLLDVPLDSYSSILDIDRQLVNISKRRGGVGIDLSNLRPRGTPTKNAARTSTGITSWMERYSNSIREVGQGGRRGALMLTISIHHPDILDFITIKNDPSKVTGANISVRLSKEFLNAVKKDKEYELRWPLENPKIIKKISAKEVWQKIIHSAWLRAEPGLLMWDNVVEQTPADYYENYKSRGTNPSLKWNTKVLTNKGWYEIKTLSEIDTSDLMVLSINDKWESFKCFKSGINKQLYKITFYNDKEVFCTAEHKWPIYGFEKYTPHPIYIGKFETQFICHGMAIIGNNNKESTIEQSLSIIKSIEPTDIYEDVYDITVNDKTHTFYTEVGFTGNCSEINLSPLDSCRLLLQNLLSFVKNPFTKDAYFDYNMFYDYSQIAQRLMDDLVDLESEKIAKIINKIDNDPEPEHIKKAEKDMWIRIKKNNDEGRRTGLGITALGDTLAALGIKYGSKKSIQETEEIYKTMKIASYRSSVEMAAELGPFKDYDSKLEENCPFIKRIKEEDLELYNYMTKFGRRNISLITTAPAGSCSILTQTTSGIEPIFMMGYTRRKKINHNDNNIEVDFTDDNGDSWQEFMVYHPTVKKWMEVTGETNLEKSPWFGCTASEIDWVGRVKLQAAAQKHVCHALSSTINLPESVSEKEVAKIYETAFDSGCKGITIYRDNCRSGVLVNKKENKSFNKERPKELSCDVHHIKVRHKDNNEWSTDEYFVLIGLLNNIPYEIFAGKNGQINPNVNKGKIIKVRKHYRIEFDDGTVVDDINSLVKDNFEAMTRMFSTAMREGIELEKLVSQLEKVTAEDFCTFCKAIARVLKKYIPDGTESEKCPECGSKTIRQSGCRQCCQCSWSLCS